MWKIDCMLSRMKISLIGDFGKNFSQKHGFFGSTLYLYNFSDAELLKWELVMYGTDKFVGKTGYEGPLSERSTAELHESNSGRTQTATLKIVSTCLLFSILLTFFMVR
jgi:hypothetical protein